MVKEDDPGKKAEEFWKDVWPELTNAIERGELESEEEFHPIKTIEVYPKEEETDDDVDDGF